MRGKEKEDEIILGCRVDLLFIHLSHHDNQVNYYLTMSSAVLNLTFHCSSGIKQREAEALQYCVSI